MPPRNPPRRLPGDVRASARAASETRKNDPGAFEGREPTLGEGQVISRRREVDLTRGPLASRDFRAVDGVGERRRPEVLIGQGQQVEGDERRRVVSASSFTRDAAGWIRWRRASKSSPSSPTITISPSITRARAAPDEGVDRFGKVPGEWPLVPASVRPSPTLRKAIQRNPSPLGLEDEAVLVGEPPVQFRRASVRPGASPGAWRPPGTPGLVPLPWRWAPSSPRVLSRPCSIWRTWRPWTSWPFGAVGQVQSSSSNLEKRSPRRSTRASTASGRKRSSSAAPSAPSAHRATSSQVKGVETVGSGAGRGASRGRSSSWPRGSGSSR